MTIQLFEDATGYLVLNNPVTGENYQLAQGDFLSGEFESHARAILSGAHREIWEGAKVNADVDNEELYTCIAALTGGQVWYAGGEKFEETKNYILGVEA